MDAATSGKILRRLHHSHVLPVEQRHNSPLLSGAPASAGGSPLDGVSLAPPDPILGLTAAFKSDKFPQKVNLGVGAYRTENGDPYVLESVRKAEEVLLQKGFNKEYLPIDGLPEFTKLSAQLCLGENSAAIKQNRVCTVQCLSGTGSLRVGGEFVRRFFPKGTALYLPNPSWGNHKKIFGEAGLEVRQYTYVSPTMGLDFDGMMADLKAAPAGSVILLHACAHNPTGVDPSKDQWKQIADVIGSRRLFAFFDNAYQGFATGDAVRDRFAIELFEQKGLSFFIAQSYAKNMGLYGERVGALNAICASQDEADRVRSQIKLIIRPMYSSPPIHGARIVATILSDPALNKHWLGEVKMMADRIAKMRQALFDELNAIGTPGNWDHILKQIGMFSFTGLKKAQVQAMVEKHHIYMTADGRISMAGVAPKNVKYLASCIKDVVLNH